MEVEEERWRASAERASGEFSFGQWGASSQRAKSAPPNTAARLQSVVVAAGEQPQRSPTGEAAQKAASPRDPHRDSDRSRRPHLADKHSPSASRQRCGEGFFVGGLAYGSAQASSPNWEDTAAEDWERPETPVLSDDPSLWTV